MKRRDLITGLALAGMGSGGVFLLLLGFTSDPAWLAKFRAASEVVLDRTLGVHSNIFSFAYLACGQQIKCMWLLGTPVTILLLSVTSYYLWHNAARLAPWEAFNLILPVGFVATIYLWSYDQLTYVIPITWIAARLVERTRSYIPSFVFIIVLDAVSMTGLLIQATTHKDRLSIVTTVLTLGLSLLLMHTRPRPATRTAAAAG